MSKKLIYLLSFVLVLGLANNASSQPTGEILVEWWLGIGGDELTRLTGIADFPDNPTGSSTLNTLEVPRSNRPAELSVLDNNYGARLQGCIWPPASGDYTFWITGDNNSQFWLSTDADPANVVMMCEVPGVNSTGSREWTKFPVQKSDAVTLKGGRAYYFDVLFKEGGGGDGVAVGWGGPTIGAGPVVIEGDYLSLPVEPSFSNAFNPSPADGVTDVPREVVLSWEPGEFAAPTNGHKVYFGESFNDVNDAVGAVAQTAASYTPAQRLDLYKTYYWRVDEVNAPPTSHIEFKGDVWSFIVEPFAYPIEDIIATASSSAPNQGPENTVNGSGLDDSGLLHGFDSTGTMWLSSLTGVQPSWIAYEFDRLYKLHDMWIWNYNDSWEQVLGVGLKDATIEYSVDGSDYTTLSTTHEFAQGSGTPDHAHNTTIDFGDVIAKRVRITANSNWGGGVLNQYGLSEVRLSYVPVVAREPSPVSGATDVDVDVVLAWRAGREAASHDVYIGDDPNALALAGSVTGPTFAPASLALALGQSYYWRVDEVNDAETPTTWQGDLWSFSTQEFLVVDDFESYNDIEAGQEGSNFIYTTWSDGYDNPTVNGSTIGYTEAFQPSMENEIVHGGDQSVPLVYDNSVASLSEVTVNTSDLPIGRDWTKGAAETLVLWFYGNPDNAVTDRMYVKVNGVKVDYPGDAADIAKPEWTQWNIDLVSLGISLSNVSQLSIGFERTGVSGGTGTVLIDDILLYRSAP